MPLTSIILNKVLIAGLLGWSVAQIIKVPLEYIRTRRWDWSLLFRAGGMPSSHSALIMGVAHAIGLTVGFDSPLYALSIAIAMIVIYDATGIRRQAGRHAKLINIMIDDLVSGHPLKSEHLLEVLGHTPLEATGGVLLGFLSAQLVITAWH